MLVLAALSSPCSHDLSHAPIRRRDRQRLVRPPRLEGIRVEEVNFWRPSPEANFKVLQPGELLLFKLKSPNDSIAGGGFFTRFLQMPINMAWETFGEANGVRSLPSFDLGSHAFGTSRCKSPTTRTVGCIMLAEPFFWPKSEWIPRPPEFASEQSSRQDFRFGRRQQAGRLWDAVCERLKRSPA